MKRWFAGWTIVLIALPVISCWRRCQARPDAGRHTRRRARGTDILICRVSGRSSTRRRGTSRIIRRASACPPARRRGGRRHPVSARRARRREGEFRKPREARSGDRCYLPGVPRITYMPHPFRIVQQADRVTILYEYLHAVRYVFMNGNPHPEGPIDWWMGDSRGRWEGNTLVVDVIHLSDRTWLDRAGNFHSEARTSSNATRPPARITCCTRSRSRTRRCSPGPGR